MTTRNGMGPTRAALMAGLLLAAGCSDEPAGALPPPVAGLVHPELVLVGQTATLDASTSAVAASARPGQPGSRIAKFRFTIADGSAQIEQVGAQLGHVFAAPGAYAVAVTVVDDRGLESTATSRVHVVEAYAPGCSDGDATACASGQCAGDTCAVLACAGDPACATVPGSLVCDRGTCTAHPGKPPAAHPDPGEDAGRRRLLDSGP